MEKVRVVVHYYSTNEEEWFMQQLDVKADGNKTYIEYKGVVLQVQHSRKQQHGAYDFLDMNPRALSGGSEMADDFEIGDFRLRVISDTDNEAYRFEYWARDIDETHFEVVLIYYLSRGGEQQRIVGRVAV